MCALTAACGGDESATPGADATTAGTTTEETTSEEVVTEETVTEVIDEAVPTNSARWSQN